MEVCCEELDLYDSRRWKAVIVCHSMYIEHGRVGWAWLEGRASGAAQVCLPFFTTWRRFDRGLEVQDLTIKVS